MKTKTNTKKEVIKFIQLISAVIAILILASCSEDETLSQPKAIFSTSTNAALVGEMITFSNQSIGADTYYWDFGDGQTSQEEEPTYAFSKEGIYEVSLNASNNSGSHVSTTKIEISDKPNSEPSTDSTYLIAPDGYLTTFRFDKVDIGSQFSYGQDHQINTVKIYQPKGADFDKPLVLLAPGGGWSSFSREEELSNICEKLAYRGYAVGLMHYSLKSNGQSANVDVQVKSVIDQRNAIRYFKANAAEYKIDPNNIFIGGWSTGAIISLANAVIQDDDVALIQSETIRSDTETALAKYASRNLYTEQNYDVQGALMMFGWMYELDVIESTDTPMMLINHKDAVMGDGKTYTWGTFNFGGQDLYGFDAIRDRAIEKGYTEGENLEYIKMTGAITMSNYASVEAMSLRNIDQISQFFFNNLNK